MSSDEYTSSKNLLFERLNELDTIFSHLHELDASFSHVHRKISIDTVNFFEREFKFLDIFLSFQSFTDEPNMLDVARKVHALFHNAAVAFSELSLDQSFYRYTSNVRKGICLTKKEIRDKYSFPKISLPLQSNKDGVMEFIDTVVERLNVLVVLDEEGSLMYVPKAMRSILNELNLLQDFLVFVSARFIEPQSQHHVVNLFRHVLAVAGHTSLLVWLYLPWSGSWNLEYLDPGEVNGLFSHFLRMMIRPIRPCIRGIYVDVLRALKSTIQSGCYPNILIEHAVGSEIRFVETIIYNLVELRQDSNSTQRVALEDHLETLGKMINFFRPNIIQVPIQELEFVLREIDTVIIDVGLLVYSLYEGEEENVDNAQVLDFSGKIQRISTMVYPIIRKRFQFNLPRIHGLGYVDFLLNNLKEFQSRYSDSLASVRNHLQKIQKEIESLQPFLEAVVKERHSDLEKVQHSATQLIGRAYEVEYIVDAACISKQVPVWCLDCWFSDIVKEIRDIRAEVEKIEEKKRVEGAMSSVTTQTSSDLSRTPKMNEEIVGFEDVIEKLRDQLIRGTKKRDVIAIVGMPGLGKTTLAYRLYCDRSVASHFDIRAECCVSQVYSRKDLLLALLRDVTGEDSKFGEKSADELADKLRKTLFPKRYLILVDDMWGNSVWDDLVRCFHDANNGSRIILTTRNHGVANHARYASDPFPLRMFNDDESWNLLSKKVFGQKSWSPLLTNIGQQIAKKCGHLPLSIVLVAGILAKMEGKEECWKQVANNLVPHIHKDSRAIIELSYQNLPYHLRSCFLYFGAFLEDHEISVTELTRLWISEGFIKSCEGKSLEDIAVGYLDNLIGRNLVTGARRSSGGKVKACRVHDLLYDFCKERANEENLLLSIRWDQSDSPDVSTQDQPAHRLSIFDNNGGGRSRELASSRSLVGSIIVHNQCLSNYQVYNILHNFKFLKVLDLKSTTIRSYPTELVYLRYFSAETKKSIPSSIVNLWNLETLILENRHGGWSLPVILWTMDKLRHLNINKGFVITNAEKLLENTALETLTTAHFCCVEDANWILRKTPNLRKLSCGVKSVDNFQDHELNFPRLETLNIRGPVVIPRNASLFCISAPNLKNLKLTSFHLVPSNLSNIGLLQNLQVLKLYCITFDKEEWEVRIGDFLQLKFLKLDLCDHLSEWSTVSDDAFPNLERLFLRYCKNLKEIPSCFKEISSLKSIEVDSCNKSVAKSARDIRKTQVEDYQNSGLVVFINGREDVTSDSGDDDDEQENEEDEY